MFRDDRDESAEALVTRRLRLRALRMADAPAVARLAGDRLIAEMTTRIPHPYTLGNAEAFIAAAEDGVFALARRADGELLGVASLTAAERDGEAELGYWIGRPFRGEGYATEAAQAVIDHGFGALGLAAIEVRCRVVNGASRRVIGKCGFGYCGTGISMSLAAGRVASETYRMDRGCWQALKNWSRAG